ncbi:light-inducible protein CPRF2 isoform X2 [Argentina anserina]|uniref:light-inducible protein CPRF2 isoform X2 n=1 Tax=Argentina anserina TaxID=57926 RepID=UPI0021765E4B|nr:light-inducible protein CPRF2 isoform X2 [Potentilla anserina]
MHSAFPADEISDISDTFWASSPSLPMNRSASEWAFEQFLEGVVSPPPPQPPAASAHSSTSKREDVDEEVVEIEKPDRLPQQHLNCPPPPPSTAPMNSDQYNRELLKSKLDLACAAVALTRPVESGNVVTVPQPWQLTSALHNNKGAGYGLPQSEADTSPVGIPALPAVQKKAQTTSGSSKDDSDDDDLEGDIEITENMDPADVKRARRMLSNRESARRSRRRKQAQMTDLETQAGQLRLENSALLKQLTDVNHKYDNSVVDRRILEANIETLRAKVKMAEESVKRKTGINPLLLAMSNVVPRPTMGSLGNPMDGSANASVAMQPTSNHLFHPVAPNINTPPHHQRLDTSFPGNPSIPPVGNQQSTVGQPIVRGSNTTEVPSAQHPATVDHNHHMQQQQLRPGVNPREALPGWNPQVPQAPHAVPKNKK